MESPNPTHEAVRARHPAIRAEYARLAPQYEAITRRIRDSAPQASSAD